MKDDVSSGEFFVGRATLVIAIVALAVTLILPAALRAMLLVICIACLYGGWFLWRKDLARSAITVVSVAVLFNPIFPLSLYVAVHGASLLHSSAILVLQAFNFLAILAVASAYFSLRKRRG